MSTRIARLGVAAFAVFITATGLTACGANDAQSGDDGPVIALLLPESKTTRYEAFDRPIFEDKVKELCDDCTVKYYNADQDESKQDEQVDAAIGEGADVIVLDPVNGDGADGMVKSAQDSGAKVIAYDRFISAADYYMSFDNETVGKLQAETLIKQVGPAGGDILMLNGAPSDPNAADFKKGAKAALKGSKLNVVAEYDNPDWSPEKAQTWTSDQLAKFQPKDLVGIYAANDGQAGGSISALEDAGVKSADLPPVTGQDSELAAIQRIVAGTQSMTIYKSIKTEAEQAAVTAVDIANDKEITDTEDFRGVPSFIFDPIVVTQDNIQDTVVKDGFWSVDDICTDDFATACTKIGLK